MSVVSNSSPLISLGKLDMLFLLKKLYGRIIVLQAVYEEVVVRGLKEDRKDAFQVVSLIEGGIICIENVDVGEGARLKIHRF
jgi:predicted nucleic acid-binding protein